MNMGTYDHQKFPRNRARDLLEEHKTDAVLWKNCDFFLKQRKWDLAARNNLLLVTFEGKERKFA